MTKTEPTRLQYIDLGQQFYTLGDSEPDGPFIHERDRFLTCRHFGRRPKSNERFRFTLSSVVFRTWSDACDRLAEIREEKAEELLREAVALRLKGTEK